MSLPNGDDDDNGRPPWRNPVGGPISPVKKLLSVDTSNDDRTADETSVGSLSFSTDTTSVVGTPTSQRGGRRRSRIHSSSPMSALTANTALADDNSTQSGASFNTGNATDIQLRRRRNRRQLQQLGIATGATFALFVYMLIPTALLLSMILFGSVSSAFLFQLAAISRWEFQRSILEGRGIGDYLPAGLYELLTSTSVHEFMSDPNGIFGASEHLPYLLLYMIPGLTPEQLDRYISRLSPTHQRLLRNEQGLLGFLLNRNDHHRIGNTGGCNQDSTLMRVIMGDERLREWRQQQVDPQQQQSNTSQRRIELPPTIPEEESPTSISRVTPHEESSPAGNSASLESSSSPPSEGIPSTVAAIVGSTTVPNPPPSSASTSTSTSTQQAPQSPEGESEEIVLMDALGAAVANIVGGATNTVRERAQESFRETLAVPIYRTSIGVMVLGLGIGAFGISNGTYDLQSLTRPITELVSNTIGGLLGLGRGSGGGSQSNGGWGRFSMPSNGLLVGSTIASGTTAVVLGLFGMPRGGGDTSDGGETPLATSSTIDTKTSGDETAKPTKS